MQSLPETTAEKLPSTPALIQLLPLLAPLELLGSRNNGFLLCLVTNNVGELGEPSLSLPWIQEVIVYTKEGCGTGAEQRQEQGQMERRQRSLAGESKD